MLVGKKSDVTSGFLRLLRATADNKCATLRDPRYRTAASD